jgi:hypothetical protein
MYKKEETLIQYRLYPPFLYYPECNSFSDTWEYFTCKLLNLYFATDEIYIRNPPEQGIDLYFPSRRIAFQCKSVESGKSGDFNVTNAINSIESALKIKEHNGWQKYILCTNVNISGKTEDKLRSVLSDIIIYPKSFWIELCKKFHIEVENNFRILLEIPRQKIINSIDEVFINYYAEKLKKSLSTNIFPILLYSNRHDTVYKLEVSDDLTIDDLIEILRAFFKLPESRIFESEGIKISLSHSIVFKGKKIPLNKTIKDAGIKAGNVITYWTTFIWEEQEVNFNGDIIHLMTADMLNKMTMSKTKRKEKALEKFSQLIKDKFNDFDRLLHQNI